MPAFQTPGTPYSLFYLMLSPIPTRLFIWDLYLYLTSCGSVGIDKVNLCPVFPNKQTVYLVVYCHSLIMKPEYALMIAFRKHMK